MTMDWNATDDWSSSSTTLHQDDVETFYVVQKCWYSGPRVEPAVDYLRLLTTAAAAEHVAYQSAHCYAAAHNAGVRTLLLNKDNSNNKQQSSSQYGFYAAGSLFWIRQMQAVSPCPSTPPHGGGDSMTAPSGAHVMLTAGVIGGTGNPNSRRTLYHDNCIFVGAGSAVPALQASKARSVHGCKVTYVPVSPYCPGDWWKDWPDRHTWGKNVLQQQQHVHEQPDKRRLQEAEQQVLTQKQWSWNASPTPRAAKRQCRADPPMPAMEATPTIHNHY